MGADKNLVGNPEVKRIVSLDLTSEQQEQLRAVLGESQPLRRLHIDELTGQAARSVHPSLVMCRISVCCW